ncbi:MAG: Obg family GTPase CgtA [Chthoniobacterales bacterium]
MFVDRIKVFAQAGSGGRGAVSFRREKFVPKGGPDGGDGGRGGDIILKADSHVDNLSSLFYEPIIKAKNGGHGMGKKMYGRAAPNKIVKVPVGTMVYRSEGGGKAERPSPNVERRMEEGEEENTELSVRALAEEERQIDEREDKENVERRTSNAERRMEEEEGRPATFEAAPAFTPEGIAAVVGQAPGLPNQSAIRNSQPAIELVADLTEDGQEFLLAKGGGGGKGNVHFKSSRNRAPRQYTEGEEGEQGHFLFELRTIADAGLVGYPNAGKSTLLRTISAARPKVAAYPFTTLHPIVGIVELSGYRRATIADIPGLIEGAHRNVGLGHDFLRHITRCRVLVFVLDIAGSEARSPIEDLQQLRREIDLYDSNLSHRPWFVVANKMDLPEAEENLAQLRARFPKTDVLPISAANREGIDELKQKLADALL